MGEKDVIWTVVFVLSAQGMSCRVNITFIVS
jgi:hypothetical protein